MATEPWAERNSSLMMKRLVDIVSNRKYSSIVQKASRPSTVVPVPFPQLPKNRRQRPRSFTQANPSSDASFHRLVSYIGPLYRVHRWKSRSKRKVVSHIFFLFLRTRKTVENEPLSHRAQEPCCASRKLACKNVIRDNVDLFDCPTSTFPPHHLGHLAVR